MKGIRLEGDSWIIRGPLEIHGRLEPPGDKSLAHRAILFAALSQGECVLAGSPGSEDVRRTWQAVQNLGVDVQVAEGTLRIRGGGLRGLQAPVRAIDCGNSGTSMRLLCGILAAQGFSSRLVGDDSLSRRPMGRVTAPLRSMGGRIQCDGPGERPPLRIDPPLQPLRGMQHQLSVDSAQVRTALLLAALYARGPTRISPVGAARDHTQRLMKALGVPLHPVGDGLDLVPSGESWDGFEFVVPGDLSGAAFHVAGCLASPPGRLQVERVGLNPGRAAYLHVLQRAGASVTWCREGTTLGEPWGSFEVQGPLRRPLTLRGAELVQCLDEVPALLVACAASGVAATVYDAAELRLKESDRIARLAETLRAFGATVREFEDGLELREGSRLHGSHVSSHGDHRLAMAAAVLAARCSGESRIDGVSCVGTSYPRFPEDLRLLAAP